MIEFKKIFKIYFKNGTDRSFNSMFGLNDFDVKYIWNNYFSVNKNKFQPIHLLWTLMFLKLYLSIDVLIFISINL